MGPGRVWVVSDHERVETGDDAEPRLAVVVDTPQLAHLFAAALNSREHPGRSVGYAYDFRVSEHPVYLADSDWKAEDIVAQFEVERR